MFTDSDDFDIRYSTLDDGPYLQKWLKYKGMLHWFPPSEGAELENFVRVWMGFCRYQACLTATYKGQPIGMGVLFLMPYRKVAHHCMMHLVVDPEYQNKGVGRALVKNLNHLGKTRFKLELVHLEVLDEYPFIDMLKSLGFTEFGRQELFVKEKGSYFPRILMECELA